LSQGDEEILAAIGKMADVIKESFGQDEEEKDENNNAEVFTRN
jgi:hypothetical protein